MTSIFMPSGKIITADSLFVRHRFARNNLDVENPKSEIEGLYKMIIRRADGSIRQETEWFKNIVTDAGLNQWMGGNPVFVSGSNGSFKVGTGTAAPAANQTTLAARVASTNALSDVPSAYVFSTSAPWWVGFRWSGRFGPGLFTGQALNEIGIGWDTTSCFSRALITPDGITPGSINVQADESLDVFYEYRVYPVTTDTTGSIVLAGTTYNFTIRPGALNASNANSFAESVRSALDAAQNPGSQARSPFGYASGSLGAVTSTVSGADFLNGAVWTDTHVAYTNGTFQRQHSTLWGLNWLNGPGGPNVQVLALCHARLGSYQYLFNAPIPKGPTKTLRLDFNSTMVRRP